MIELGGILGSRTHSDSYCECNVLYTPPGVWQRARQRYDWMKIYTHEIRPVA